MSLQFDPKHVQGRKLRRRSKGRHKTCSAVPASHLWFGSHRRLRGSGLTMCSEIAVGDVIRGRFVLEKELGSGGMGTVFKALDRLRQEARDREPYVAVKVLSETFRRQPLSFIALQREAKKAQKLNHPNIVRVYDFDRDGSTIFL